MRKKFIYEIALFAILIIATFILLSPKTSSYSTVKNFDGKITFYKGASCGCCGLYMDYFKSKGNKNMQFMNVRSNTQIMTRYEIPSSMESCHTTILTTNDGKEYFVEGHVPLEAIEKLLLEKPDIKGIAIPGMPDGTPGMPGSKKGIWTVYQINNDGIVGEFMKI